MAKYMTFRTESWVGNAPFFFTTLRNWELIDSIALVVCKRSANAVVPVGALP